MRKNIIDKIDQVAKEKIQTEAQVMYILIQCGKCLDAGNSPVIRLFRNWVAHNELTILDVKKKLDNFSDFFLKQKDDGMFGFMEEGFTLFKDLKDEFLIFSEENGIDTDFIKNTESWCNFIQILFKILKDIPLKSDGEIRIFSFTDEIVEHDGYSAISFRISFANGATKHFTMHPNTILGCRDI